MPAQELLSDLFRNQPHPLAAQMAEWLVSSRRFAMFAATFEGKIRKKLRATQGSESLHDLQFELETAYLLLQDRLLSVAYEPTPPRQARCPDFAVSYTTSMTFMLEATRLRAEQPSRGDERVEPLGAESGSVQAALRTTERLADTVCHKLHQLLPQCCNVLVVGVEGLVFSASELRDALVRIQQRAEQNDAAWLRRHKFHDRADFFQHYQRLSEVLVRGLHQPTTLTAAWANPQARHPLPGKVRTALYHSHAVVL